MQYYDSINLILYIPFEIKKTLLALIQVKFGEEKYEMAKVGVLKMVIAKIITRSIVSIPMTQIIKY